MKKYVIFYSVLILLTISCDPDPQAVTEMPDEEAVSGQVITLNNGHEGDEDGNLSTALFNEPIGIEASIDGSLYVADNDNFKIRKISPEGEVTTFAGSQKGHADGMGENAAFHSVGYIEEAPDGSLYLSDSFLIRKISPAGEVTTLTGLAGKGNKDGNLAQAMFNAPSGIAVGKDGVIYIADRWNHSIRKISPDGIVTTIAGGELGYEDGPVARAKFDLPADITVGQDGNLYIVDSGNHRIRKITPAGEVSTLSGDGVVPVGTGYGAMFIWPQGIESGKDGNIYVADSYHYRVRRITPDGEVTTIAGDIRGYTDGSLKEAQFADIFGITLDQNGAIFLTEPNDDRIRRIVTE